MPDRSKKRPRDPNALAYQVFLESIGETEKFDPAHPELNTADLLKNPNTVALGRLGGLKGGAVKAAKLTPKKRSQIAARRRGRGGKRSKPVI